MDIDYEIPAPEYGIVVDEYRAVLLRPETISGIAEALKNHARILIGFTDEEGSYLSILFTLGGYIVGDPRFGLRNCDLFVTLIGYGGYGFAVPGDNTHAGYVSEKLGFDKYNQSSTAKKLTELINGVRRELGVWFEEEVTD